MLCRAVEQTDIAQWALDEYEYFSIYVWNGLNYVFSPHPEDYSTSFYREYPSQRFWKNKRQRLVKAHEGRGRQQLSAWEGEAMPAIDAHFGDKSSEVRTTLAALCSETQLLGELGAVPLMRRDVQRTVIPRGIHMEPQSQAVERANAMKSQGTTPYGCVLQLTKPLYGWKFEITGYGILDRDEEEIAAVQSTLLNLDRKPVLHVQWESPVDQLHITSPGGVSLA